MIPANRFIIRQTEYEGWLEARRHGVSATAVAAAATPSGFRDVVSTWGQSIDDNPMMAFGREAEPELMRHAHREYGILASDWLIAGENPRHLATPDGLSLDHTEIAECKTTGDGWDGAETNPKKLPIRYRRQVQYQLMVTGAERCLFLWQLRVPDDHGWFYMPWLQPKTVWIDRDPDMIRDLTEVADRLFEEAVNGTV